MAFVQQKYMNMTVLRRAEWLSRAETTALCCLRCGAVAMQGFGAGDGAATDR